jgi:hypothetical protein
VGCYETLSRKVEVLLLVWLEGLFDSLGSLQYYLQAFIDFQVFRASLDRCTSICTTAYLTIHLMALQGYSRSGTSLAKDPSSTFARTIRLQKLPIGHKICASDLV